MSLCCENTDCLSEKTSFPSFSWRQTEQIPTAEWAGWILQKEFSCCSSTSSAMANDFKNSKTSCRQCSTMEVQYWHNHGTFRHFYHKIFSVFDQTYGVKSKKTWKPTSYSCWTTTHTSFQKPHEMKLTNMALSPVSEH